MMVEKNQEFISFKQSKWLKKYISFNTKQGNRAKNDFEKNFFELLVNAAFGNFLKNVRDLLRLDLIEKDDIKNITEQQSKLTFDGIHKSYENCDKYIFKQNEVVMDKAIYVGFAILEKSRLQMIENYYDKLQPYFGLEHLQLHYKDTDGVFLSMRTESITNDLKKLGNFFHLSNLDENHKLFSNKNKKVIDKFKIGTPKNIWIDKFVC